MDYIVYHLKENIYTYRCIIDFDIVSGNFHLYLYEIKIHVLTRKCHLNAKIL